MPLLDSPRLTDLDRTMWRAWEPRLRRCAPPAWKVERAKDSIREFCRHYAPYVSISWGKDSLTVAHLARQVADLPLLWMRVPHRENPEAYAVRDAFLTSFPCSYVEREVEMWRSTSDPGVWEYTLHHHGDDLGNSRITGLRAEETPGRRMSARAHGVTHGASCRPIIWWSTQEVLGYLLAEDVPIPAVYAMMMGGRRDPLNLRMEAIGGEGGIQEGRREWESEYFRDILDNAALSALEAI